MISGGQTGADQGGLFAARERRIDTGGTVPKGWKTETGPAPWLAKYGCVEAATDRYPFRTERNVVDSSGTLIFGDVNSPGSRLTIDFCRKHRKVWKVISPNRVFMNEREVYQRAISEVKSFLELYDVTTLNVAGNRESTNPGIGEFTKRVLLTVFPPYRRPH